jgi:hypothetical protein
LIKRLFIFYEIKYEIIISCRPFRALGTGFITRPVGAGYNLDALSGRRLQRILQLHIFEQK